MAQQAPDVSKRRMARSPFVLQHGTPAPMDHEIREPQPMMWYSNGQQRVRRRLWARLPVTHILFFLATLASTTFFGALHNNINLFEEPWRFYQGLPFSLTLLAVLGTHEFGHYWMARYHGVPVTLPYFIPAPSIIGTFGAFIRIKDVVPNRSALFDIGVAGPIAGFVVAVPAIVLGITLSDVRPTTGLGDFELGSSLLFNGLVQLLLGVTPKAYDVVLHPIAFAGWIGFLVTALNLIPAGQLDGGHIVYSLSGRWHRLVTILCLLAMLPLGWYCWVWWIWAVVIFMFSGPHTVWRYGWRFAFMHPPLRNEAEPLSRAQKWIAVVSLIIFAITFPPVPFTIPFN
jgi:membrane-associated protease RseP (regulator of RpoE activity)